MNKEQAEEFLRSLTVVPEGLTQEEYMNATGIVLPRLLNKSGFEDPAYETSDSACFDIRSTVDVLLVPGQTTIVPTGLYLTMENAVHWVNLNPNTFNMVLNIRPRSGLATKGVMVGAGEVDRDYLIENNEKNEIKIVLHYLGTNGTPPIEIKAGDRIAQARWNLIGRDPFLPVKKVVRKGGFGSSGSV